MRETKILEAFCDINWIIMLSLSYKNIWEGMSCKHEKI